VANIPHANVNASLGTESLIGSFEGNISPGADKREERRESKTGVGRRTSDLSLQLSKC
jgi:hypothetical protein